MENLRDFADKFLAAFLGDFLTEFGMTPSSRARVKAQPVPQGEDLKQWFG